MKSKECRMQELCDDYHDDDIDAGDKRLIEMSFKAGVTFAEQWISIEDELPEKYVEVFVKVKSSNSIFSCYLTDENKFVGDDFPIEDYIEMDVCKWRPVNRK